jgi:coproporphyrinogen III oxidase
MPIEQKIRERLDNLISVGIRLAIGNSQEVAIDLEHRRKCLAWFVPVQNLLQIICPDANSAYFVRANQIIDEGFIAEWEVNTVVGQLTELLIHLRDDINHGLLSSIIDSARAETFDDFLDHAKEYICLKRKNESGVIAGVVFEDTIRRICDKNSISQKGESLENLINTLVKANVISTLKAKRAKAAAHVRTKATHAQWDEFELDDVEATISFTRDLITSKLDQ